MPLRKDIWRPAIVAAPVAAIARAGSLAGLDWRWLPDSGPFRFLADPFGLWRDDRLHVFVERYDYRDRHGVIDVLVHDRDLVLRERRMVLRVGWHLSYPFVFEGEGATWMLPEASRSGTLTLYRAAAFPDGWEPVCEVALPRVAVDATPWWHDGRWWLFHSAVAPRDNGPPALYVAFADRLAGPWHDHPANPVRVGADGARPGGTPFHDGEGLVLPVQDCTRTYGGAIRLLRVAALDPARVVLEPLGRLTAPPAAGRLDEGLHTLAGAGPVTLVDVKRTVLSPRGLAIEARRELLRKLRRATAG